jgi:dTDP-4-dehydrorhamnose 3,5-epimerase
MNTDNLIEGKVHNDSRGSLTSYDEFSFDSVKRMYIIENLNSDIVRAWQAHKREQKWFYVCSGSFLFVTIQIDNFASPSEKLRVNEWVISANKYSILHVPGGFANGFRSLSADSRLVVFSSSTLKESKEDDYRFEANRWYNWIKQEPLV